MSISKKRRIAWGAWFAIIASLALTLGLLSRFGVI